MKGTSVWKRDTFLPIVLIIVKFIKGISIIANSETMAPKKKSKSGKGSKGSSGIIDGVSITEMSREQLESFVSHIQLELEREREERNFFQLERDKIRTFWEITRQQLEEDRACLKNKEKELENAEAKHQHEMKIFQQKIKHLMYEQHSELSRMELKNMIVLQDAEENYAEQELCLLNDIKELKSKNMEDEDAHLCQIRSKIKDTNDTVEKIRSNYESNCRILENKYQRSLEQFRKELEFQNEIQVNEIEERKNKFVKMLLESHDKIYKDIMQFYTEITAKNLALISVLKDKLIKLREENSRMLLEIQNIRKQNQKLVIPLKMAQQCVQELQHKVNVYERDHRAREILEKQHNILRKKCDDLQCVYDTLKFSYEQMERKKGESERKLISEFLQFQENTTYHNILLGQKVSELKNVVESREVDIIDYLKDDDRHNYTRDSKNIQDKMNEKNEKISSLTKELVILMKAHSDVIQNDQTLNAPLPKDGDDV